MCLRGGGDKLLDFRQLKYFVGIVEAGSFTKAAAELHVAQSALSLHVRQMEERYGVSLFVRERTGIRLTEQGEKLLVHARIILNQLAQAESELSNKSDGPAGQVSVAVPSGAARVVVPELLAVTGQMLPQVSLKITEGMSGQLDEWMAAGRFNLALLYRAPAHVGRSLELAREDLYLVAPASHPPFVDAVELTSLASFPLAMPMASNNVRRSLMEAVTPFGVQLDVKYEIDSLSTILGIVASGKAYSVLPCTAVQNELKDHLVKLIRIVEPGITRSVVVAGNPRDEGSAAVAAVRSVLVETVRKLVTTGEWRATLLV